MDAERGRAHALLRVLACTCVSVDAVERGELDHDGCGHGQRQFSGSHHHLFPTFPIPGLIPVKSVLSSRYVP